MAPTIVTRDGRPFLAVGSPGGASIITTVLQVLLERLDLGASLPEAIARPRASQRNAVTTEAEPAFVASPEGAALDAGYGHDYRLGTELAAVTALERLDRPPARGRGTGAPRRRQRRCRPALEFREMPSRLDHG